MVYCGVPSKACAPCRSKRTKCDLIRPSCTQCKRTGRECEGYRNNSDLQIRDQTQSISEKHSHRRSPASSLCVIEYPCPSGKAEYRNVSMVEEPLFLLPHISKDPDYLPEDLAASFFFNEYVVGDSVISHSLFDSLPSLYSQASAGSAISKTITALGMSCLSSTMKSSEVMSRAGMRYTEALRLLNSALQCPIQARLDETLMIVILLGLYEENNTASRSLEAWNNHVNGAVALLDFRGEEQVCSNIGRKLISALRTQVIVNSLVRRVKVPKKVIDWSRLARPFETSEENAENELAEIIAQYCELIAVVDSPLSKSNPLLVVEKALDIDIELADWAVAYQITNFYTEIDAEPSPEVLLDHWHNYRDIGIAAVCNHYRSIRLMTNQLLIAHLNQAIDMSNMLTEVDLSLLTTCNDQGFASRSLILELSQDICASVPYFLGDAEGIVPRPNAQRAHGKLLLWPIYVAGQTEYISDLTRSWVVNRLEKINQVGTDKAGVLARMLKAGTYTKRVWREQIPEEARYGKGDGVWR